MLDTKLIRHEGDKVKEALRGRGADPSVIDRLRDLDARRRDWITKGDEKKALRNQVSKELGVRKKAGEDITEEAARMRALGEEIAELDAMLKKLEADFNDILACIPNLPDASVPEGKDAEQNVEVRRWGTPAESDGLLPHWDLGEQLDIMDFKRSAKISGSRFWVLKGLGARLERAIISYFLDLHTSNGYTEVLVPALVNKETLFGTGQLPKFEEDLFRASEDLYLIPTSEVPVTNLHAQEILDGNELPKHYTAFSPCFRSEAGAAGKDTRGLVRVHQFHKVEMVKVCTPETSFDELEKMVNDAERCLQGLEIPHRVMLLCTGDMGFSAAKTYDLEFWSPAQKRWIEISSCSNCTDFQARRAQIRFRRGQNQPVEFCHTLNGSGLAVGRTVVAILENFQQPDGSVILPKVLRPYMNGVERIEARQVAKLGSH